MNENKYKNKMFLRKGEGKEIIKYQEIRMRKKRDLYCQTKKLRDLYFGAQERGEEIEKGL